MFWGFYDIISLSNNIKRNGQMKRIIFGGLMTALCAVSTQAQDLPGSFDDIGGFEVEEATTGLNLNRYIGGSLGLIPAHPTKSFMTRSMMVTRWRNSGSTICSKSLRKL